MQKYIFILMALFLLTACNNSATNSTEEATHQQKEKKVYTQEEIKNTMIPLLKKKGQVYRKVKEIKAREAKPGEEVKTITKDGLETTNVAEEGDFIVENQTEAKEQYIIGGKKFKERYEMIKPAEGDLFWYKSTGKIRAVEMNAALLKQLQMDKEFYLMAPWEAEMIVKENDFLVSPLDYSEVYRIARKEFFETYRLETEKN